MSFEEIAPGKYKLRIHISDVAALVKPGTPLDNEALKRAATTYVKKTLTIPMLPRELNAGKCSLSQGNERLCVTLTIDMNDKGIADFSSAVYSLTVLKSAARLTYEVADRLIKTPEGEAQMLLAGKCSEEVEVKLRTSLKQLYAICKSRQDFRKRYEVFASENNDNGDVS